MVYDVKSLLSSGAEKFRWCKHKAIQIESAPSARSALVLVCLFEVGAQGPAQGPRGLGPFLLNDSARRGFVVQLKLCCRLPFHVSWIGYYAESDFKTLASHLEMMTFMNKLFVDPSFPVPGLAPWKPDSKDLASCLEVISFMRNFFHEPSIPRPATFRITFQCLGTTSEMCIFRNHSFRKSSISGVVWFS